MQIAVIGTGNIGRTIAEKLIANGHAVRVANSRGRDGVRRLADAIGAAAMDVRGAVAGADVVIISVPLWAVSRLPSDLFDSVPPDVPIIDTSNYHPVNGQRVPEIDAGLPESIWVSEQIGRPVIKAFNIVLAHTLAELGQPEGTYGRLAIAVAGSDPRAKRITMDLVDQTGFDPVDAGSLEDSWRQQPFTPAYCSDFGAAALRRALSLAVREKAAEKRDRMAGGRVRARKAIIETVLATLPPRRVLAGPGTLLRQFRRLTLTGSAGTSRRQALERS